MPVGMQYGVICLLHVIHTVRDDSCGGGLGTRLGEYYSANEIYNIYILLCLVFVHSSFKQFIECHFHHIKKKKLIRAEVFLPNEEP